MWASNQLMNFCDPVFQTVALCDTVCCEGYDVTNLVSNDLQKKRHGFLSDRFIKPPVEVTLKFPFDISLSHIQIITQVGQQKSSAVEVSSTFIPNIRECASKGCGIPTKEKIGFLTIEDNEKGAVLFCPQLHGRQWRHPEANMMKMKAFTWIQRGAIVHASKLTIRIVRTLGSSVPGIGSIEVWGVPSSCLPRVKMDEVKALWRSTVKSHNLKISRVPQDVQKVKSKVQNDDLDPPPSDHVPEDFQDAITYEIMSLPMVLPSGKIVDQRTLERHAAAEACWGRSPSDPFTGIFFKSGCQPVLDVALKGRIDKFLVMNQNREDLRMVPRTVGGVGFCMKNSPSRLGICSSGVSSLMNACQKSGSHYQFSPSFNKVSRILCPNATETVTRAEDTGYDGHHAKRLKLDSSQPSSNVPVKSDSDKCPSNVTDINLCHDSNSLLEMSKHEEELDKSLQFAIKSALSGLPSFVNPVLPKVVIKNCSACKQTRTLFSLPCKHFVCRSCLVYITKQSNSVCPHCDKAFKSSDPVRCHE